MRLLITEPGGELCVLSLLSQMSTRVTARVRQKTGARVRHYVWAAALKPAADWSPIVQAFNRGHGAGAITLSSKRLNNR